MSTKKIGLSFLLVVVFSAVLYAHQFYISITTIQHHPETEKLSVQLRIFINDLEAAIYKAQGVRLGLWQNKPVANAKDHIEQYLRSRLRIAVNGSAVPLKYLDHQIETAEIVEDHVITCQLEVHGIPAIRTIKIYNSLLTEEFDSQVNIVNVLANSQKKIINLDGRIPEDEVAFP